MSRILWWSALLAIGWTVLIGTVVSLTIQREFEIIDQRALLSAKANFNKDFAFRLWGAAHGGVYVPVSDHTPPNPNLAHVPHRDIRTSTGLYLTLMNPAYMVRQLMDDYAGYYGVRGRITSLKPLWEGNVPDAWERRTLQLFEEGVDEVSEYSEISGEPYLRYMKRMVAEKNCLKCHAQQGYEEGDVRGGVGVLVPMKPLRASLALDIRRHSANYGLVWFLGLIMLGIGARIYSAYDRERDRARTVAEEESHLRGLLLDAFPYPAMLIHRNRTILAVNQSGRDLGAEVGGKCSDKFSQGLFGAASAFDGPNPMCSAECQADSVLDTGKVVNYPAIRIDRKVWDVSWIPVSDDVFLHYAVDVTRRLESQRLESVGQLAGGIAHDFNNILQSILGYGEFALEMESKGEPCRFALEQIMESSQCAAKLVSQLLAFSRRQRQQLETIDLDRLVADLSEMLQRVVGDEIVLKIQRAPRSQWIHSDAGQLEQVLVNLCSNARDASVEGGEVVLTTGARFFDAAYCERHDGAEPGPYVFLTVADTGCGMDEATRQRVFEPFFTTKEVGKGSGMGLSMVYGVVRQHKGIVDVSSEQGKGTTVLVAFPAVAPPDASAEPKSVR